MLNSEFDLRQCHYPRIDVNKILTLVKGNIKNFLAHFFFYPPKNFQKIYENFLKS